ncbi:MAG: serine/threonine protein kinase [Verrucomicrobiaceae bacterium]|nr:serine/threonine protein kinase [Verrucomicrobiaceae bacterium]
MTQRLHLISRVASGAFSTVDHVRDLDSGLELAFKRPQPGRRRAEEQLRREGEVLRSVSHPHIVALHEAGEDEEGGYLLLEWVDGETLDQRIERETFTATTLPSVLAPVLQALDAVHAAGFAHGDVSAANVLLRRDGWVKLIDFGNTWPLDETRDRSITEPNVGSVYHMAPELFSGQTPNIRSDMYALGVLAWHAITRRFPFEGETPAQVITGHLRLDLQPLPPSAISGWIHRLLSRDPSARPASALEALHSLQG